jgi:hypothetical protein
MRTLLFALLLSCSTLAGAKVINVEFKFTPFTGDIKADHVRTVAGKATVFINNLPVAEQDIEAHDVPVLFDNREVGPAVWVPSSSMGGALRRGKNSIRIEFVPAAGAPYQTQFSWASVNDQTSKKESGNSVSSTNQSDEGADNKKATGKAVFEREFSADFAADQPWHHYPPVTTLADADKQALAALAAGRAGTFKPDFSSAYQLLKNTPTPGMQLDLGAIQKARVLQKGYEAGMRVTAPPADKLDFVISGNPEVVVRARGGLFAIDEKALRRVKGEEAQMGLAMVLSVLYPPQFVAVRDPAGKWAIVY